MKKVSGDSGSVFSMVKGAEEKVKILLESSKDAFELAEFEDY